MFVKILLIFCSLAATSLLAVSETTEKISTKLASYPLGELDQKRIDKIATMLTDQPNGIGLSKPISDRAYWTDPKQVAELHKFIGQAEKRLSESFPGWNDDDYLDFSRKGGRGRGEKMENARHGWLPALVFAECLEDKGRFLPLINQILSEYAKEPTWTMPAHDKNLTSHHGTDYFLDLGAATFGLRLAETLYLLGDKLDPKVRQLLLKELDQRVFDPLQRTLATGKPCGWLGSKGGEVNNWNPVCLSGAVGAALCVIPDKETRALFIALGEHYSKYYLASFTPDGYCTEGGGYWGYGFGHYALLREEILHATDGKIDLFADPSVVPDILYAQRFRIGPTVLPPFADCRFGAKIDSKLLSYCNETLSLGLNLPSSPHSRGLADSMIDIAPTPCVMTAAIRKTSEDPLRFFFNSVGVLSCRPAAEGGLGIGIKAGGNFSHSHNDVGSYEIAIGDNMLTGDPGGPMFYDASTFSKKRFDHKLLNSYGHPVPVIGGQLQLDATKVHPTILSTSFTAERDQIAINMKPAYAVAALQKLTRSMVYNRKGAGNITITDEVLFSAPTSFEDALITHGTWKQLNDNTIEFSIGKAKLTAKITSSAPYTIKPETITELGNTFTRLGLVFNKPCLNAKFAVVFTSSY